ncbi:DNA mismatch endonuclease Vsr [Thiorhodococcus minor]
MDRLAPERRSWLMSRVASKNTSAELRVRRALHALGFRFRLHRKDLPGTPDIVLPKHRTVVFVHGCFWHRHPGCPKATTPKTRVEFWRSKFDRNVERDREAMAQLEALGWRTVVIWECETKKSERLAEVLERHFALGGEEAAQDREG